MKARIVILVVIAVGLAVYWLSSDRKPKEEGLGPERIVFDEDVQAIDEQQTPCWQRPAPGPPPPDDEPPEFSVQVWTDPTDGKNRIYFEIAEVHGYYADTFDVDFWYKDEENTDIEDSPLVIRQHFNAFLPANDTYRHYIEVVPAELDQVGGDFGTTENWAARVVHHHRARLQTPDWAAAKPD